MRTVFFGHRATPLARVVGIFGATVFSQLHYPLYLLAAIGPRSPWIVDRHAVYQARESLESTQASTRETIRLTEQGQITERFTRAIEQLGATDDQGNKRLEIRLGGIYALERIDKESPDRAYHSTVMEVLTAYVRENSTQVYEMSLTLDLASNERPPTDIQAILDILERRDKESVPENHRPLWLDLRGASLRGASLRRVDFIGADLREADLRDTDLTLAKLRRADLYGADLRGVVLQESVIRAGLEGSDLREADLTGTTLYGANLRGVDLRGVRGLKQETIDRTIGSDETQLSEGFKRPKSWSKSAEEQRRLLQS